VFLVTYLPALQVSSSSATQAPFPYGLIPMVLAIVCFVRRKRAIGGWLLWFLSGIVLAAAYTLMAMAAGYRNYLPGTWADPKSYLIFVLSRAPAYVAAVGLAVVALKAGSDPSAATLKWLSVALTVRAITGLAALAADAAFLPSLLRSDIPGASGALLVLAYLHLSVRVDRVFCKQNWNLP
jgi:hypothetical protein